MKDWGGFGKGRPHQMIRGGPAPTPHHPWGASPPHPPGYFRSIERQARGRCFGRGLAVFFGGGFGQGAVVGAQGVEVEEGADEFAGAILGTGGDHWDKAVAACFEYR